MNPKSHHKTGRAAPGSRWGEPDKFICASDVAFMNHSRLWGNYDAPCYAMIIWFLIEILQNNKIWFAICMFALFFCMWCFGQDIFILTTLCVLFENTIHMENDRCHNCMPMASCGPSWSSWPGGLCCRPTWEYLRIIRSDNLQRYFVDGSF